MLHEEGFLTVNVFVTRKIPESGLCRIQNTFNTKVWDSVEPPSQKKIIELATNCQGLVTLLSDRIDRNLMDSLPDLRVIAQYAVGYDNIDVAEATKRGIIVTNTPGVLTETTADLTWALIMAASRKIAEADRYVRNGKWNVAWGPEMLLGSDVYGATIGIIGLGRIGSAVARRAAGFSMKILYTSRSENDTSIQIEQEVGAKRSNLKDLLLESDIITLHVPLTSETNGLIGEEELALMKPGAILVNTSRGAIIDEKALVETLKSNHLGAAGLDVFQEEPLSKSSPLLGIESVVLAPHIGSASVATRSKMSMMVADNLTAALNNEKPPNIVNPEVLQND